TTCRATASDTRPSSCAGAATSGLRTAATTSSRSPPPPSSPRCFTRGPEPPPRVVVGIERFLLRTQALRHVLEVHPDPGPCGGAAAHGVHQHVRGLEASGRLGMTHLPALQAGQRIPFPGG